MTEPPASDPSISDQRDPFGAHPMATLVVAPDDRIASANGRAETLLNMARSALVGSLVADVLRIDDPNVDEGIWRTDKPLSAYDVRVHAGRMAALEMDVLVNPLADREGWRVVALHVHASPQARGLRRGTLAMQSATGAAAILAHEIKNPLSGIRGAAQLLEAEVSAQMQPLTRLIRDEVDRIAALIDRMQHFTSNQPLACRAENIYPLLDRAIDIAAAGFARGRNIARRYDPSLPPARVNGDALVQIMLNLLKNAAEASDNKDIIVSTAFRHGMSLIGERGRPHAPLHVEIQVIDHGPGVPAHIRDVLFSPFISDKRTGQGLGLALVDKLVRDMNGMVQYERDETGGREGGGQTIFRLLLPMEMAR